MIDPHQPVDVPIADKVAFLGAARNHPDRPARIAMRETHMSWVFIGERLVHKMKKPVRQEMLDLRSLDARRRNCVLEIGLNRRLAADVYRGIVPLTWHPGRGLALGGEGRPVEWLVAMRRLPDELMLDRVLAAGGPERRDLDRLAALLGRFYAGLEVVPVPPALLRRRFGREVELSRRTLRRFGRDGRAVERLAERLAAALRTPALLAGEDDGRRIVEGHGDLRPEHVCLEPLPVIIDCLEFSRRLRLIDPADEMAFLALECAMLGRPEVGVGLQRRYEEVSGDRPSDELLAFYGGFRALVRARLMALHSLEPGARTPSHWLARADRYLEAGLSHADELS